MFLTCCKEDYVKREMNFKQVRASDIVATCPSMAAPDTDSESMFPETSEGESDGIDVFFAESDCSSLFNESDDDLFPESDNEANNIDPDIFPESDDEDTSKRNTVSKPRRPKHGMTFSGKHVCQHAFQSLLSIGTSTICKLLQDEPAFTRTRQEPRPKHPVFGFCMQGQRKWFSVVLFLWIVWNSRAETLPTPFKMPHQDAPHIQDEDYSLRVVNAFLNNLEKHDYDPENFQEGPGTFAGPRRFLQHSSRTDLYWEYRAYCQAQGDNNPCQYGMFMKVANKLLKPGVRKSHLSFRKAGQFGKCDVCFDLKRRIRACKGEARSRLYKKYSAHILAQWLDRQRYWAFRTMSRALFDQARQLGLRFGLRALRPDLYWPYHGPKAPCPTSSPRWPQDLIDTDR